MLNDTPIDDRADDAYEAHVNEVITERSCRNCRHHAVSADGVSVRCNLLPGATLFVRQIAEGHVLRDTALERDRLTATAARCRNYQLST